jgi:NADP-dependent 3-hydroxy acid dehydrogenase YdfG
MHNAHAEFLQTASSRVTAAALSNKTGAAGSRRVLHTTQPAPRVMLVTGASDGVGAAVAKMAAAQGFSVALVARREEALQAVAAECPGSLPIVADVTKRPDVERAVRAAIEHFGGLDVLVNNVGRGIAAQPSAVTEEDIDEMMSINVKSSLFGMQAVLPHFKERDRGHIINVSSRLGRIPSVLPRSAYNWSKHFLNGLTANFRDEVAATHPGIAVSLVSPGLIYTDFGQHALYDGNDMRVQPGGQSKEEVASVIMQVVQTRQRDVFTKVGVKSEMMAYFDGLVEEVAPSV